jgi:predicted MFS family arabinose efflux permease
MQFRGRLSNHDSADTSGPYEFDKFSKSNPRSVSGPTSLSFAILFLACFAVNSDQLVSAPNLTLISQNFRLTLAERDSHLGALIQLGFFVSAGFFSILSGPVVEVIDRSRLIAALAGFSSLLSCCSGLVPSGRAGFFYFFLLRVSTGVSVGIVLPTAFSLLGDLVPARKRTTMGAFVTTSCAAGAAIGQALAGLSSGRWRIPYFISAVLSLTAAVLCLVVLRDPRGPGRVADSKSPENKNTAALAWRANPFSSRSGRNVSLISMEDLNWSKFHQVLDVQTNRLIFAQSFPGCIAWSSIATFLPDFLHRDLGLSIKGSTGIMAIFGISGLCCALVGSGIGQSIYNGTRKSLPAFVALCMAAGAIPMILLAVLGGNPFVTISCALLGGFAAASGPNIKGMLMNANTSSDRGSVFALFNLVDNLGKGLGPSVLVVLTWLFGGSRRAAFAIVFTFWFLSAWIAYKLEDCLIDDTLKVEIRQGNSEESREPFDLLHLYHS